MLHAHTLTLRHPEGNRKVHPSDSGGLQPHALHDAAAHVACMVHVHVLVHVLVHVRVHVHGHVDMLQAAAPETSPRA